MRTRSDRRAGTPNHYPSGPAPRGRTSLNGRRERHRQSHRSVHHFTTTTMIKQIEGYVPVETSEGAVLIPEPAWEGVRSIVEEGFGGAFTVHVQLGVVEGPDGVRRHVPYYSLVVAAEEAHLEPLFERITPVIRKLVQRHVQKIPDVSPDDATPAALVRAAIRNTLTPPDDEALPLAS